MKLSEKELEDVIYYQKFQSVYDNGLLIYEHQHVARQLSLGSYGTPDLVGFYFEHENGKLSEVYITVYELKAGEVSFEALCQVKKYIYALRQIYENNPLYRDVDFFFYSSLIGYTIDRSVDFMAASAELGVRLYTYDSTMSGVLFTDVPNYNYKPDSYEKTWIGNGSRLNLFKLANGSQAIIFDEAKKESWVSNL